MNSKWTIKNNIISNCGTAIDLNGYNGDLNISSNDFINNDKDINLYLDENSNLIIDGNKSVGCKTTSITLETYNKNIKDIKDYVYNSEDFTIIEKEKLEILINKMNTEKENPSKLKIILKEIYDISKSVSLDTLVSFIVFKMGW